MTKEFLTDGYISYTFTPQIAEVYLAYLFKTELKRVQPFHYQDSFFVWNQPPISTQAPLMILPRGQHHPNPAWLLDFAIRPGGSVVPQQLWFPQGQGDWRRYVEQAHLQMPLFFTNTDGSFGVPIVNAVAGQMVLRGGNEPAPFGDRTTTKIRIGVCVHPLPGRARHLTFISQWPGYAPSEQQVQLRDQTPARNRVTLERFVKHVGSRVRQFLMVSLYPDRGCNLGISTVIRTASAFLSTIQLIGSGGWDRIMSRSTK